MAMGDDASVPSTRSTSHTTVSPAYASRPDFAERTFSLIVWGGTSVPSARWIEGQARQIDHLERLRREVGEQKRAPIGRETHLARKRAGRDGADDGFGALLH